MSPDTIAALIIIGGAVFLALPSLLVRCMEWIERRDAMWLAESDADFLDEENETVANVVDWHSTKARMDRIRQQIADQHEKEALRLRSELDCEAAVVLWLNRGEGA